MYDPASPIPSEPDLVILDDTADDTKQIEPLVRNVTFNDNDMEVEPDTDDSNDKTSDSDKDGSQQNKPYGFQ